MRNAQDRWPVDTTAHGSDAMIDAQTCYHGIKADLRPGDRIESGSAPSYGARRQAKSIDLSATLDAAIRSAEFAVGARRGRISIVEPTGALEDDPNPTDRKFSGNPTRSSRSRRPFRTVGQIAARVGHAPERLEEMRDPLRRLRQRGVEAIED